jgi:uncharacterized DUF497 family protein
VKGWAVTRRAHGSHFDGGTCVGHCGSMLTTRRGRPVFMGMWMACSVVGCASGCPPLNNKQTTWSITNITADVATSWAGRPLGETAGSFQRALLKCPGKTDQEVVPFSPSGSPPPDVPGACATATRGDFENTGPYRIQLVQFAPFGTGPVVLSSQTGPRCGSDLHGADPVAGVPSWPADRAGVQHHLSTCRQDTAHPDRMLLFGVSSRQRLLVVVHVETDGDTTRIISARRSTSHERKRYEEDT